MGLKGPDTIERLTQNGKAAPGGGKIPGGLYL